MKKYASKYFIDTIKITDKMKHKVTLRFFSFQDKYILAGMKQVREIIEKEIPKKLLSSLTIYSKQDGDLISKKEPVLVIEGDYSAFGYLENVIDGILSRMSSIATNVYEIKKLTDKDIIFMADRSDIYLNQPYDGYAAYIGGIRKFVTESMCEFLTDKKDAQYVGTVPHSLIQQHRGNLVDSLLHYYEVFPNNKIVALIDYNNDCIGEIKKLSESKLKDKIFAVRIDTSSSLIDKSLQHCKTKYYGVNDKLIKLVRKTLDNLGMNKTKIIVSSGINDLSIKSFNKSKSPIDIYGIGSHFLKRTVFFTGDLIKLNGEYEAKTGRTAKIENYLKKMIKW